MRIAVFAAVALLSGCSVPGYYATPSGPSITRPPDPPPPQEDFASSVWRRLNTGLGLFPGLPIQSAVTMLGYPTGDRMVMGDHVYYWESGSEMPGFGDGPNFRVWCRIEMGTAPDGTIKNTHSDGNAGGCAKYANALTPR